MSRRNPSSLQFFVVCVLAIAAAWAVAVGEATSDSKCIAVSICSLTTSVERNLE